jgi:hypothetical protein
MIVLLIALTAVTAIMTLVPLLPVPHGFVRICDFPRLQIAVVAIGLAVLTLLTLGFEEGALLLLGVQFCVAAAQMDLPALYAALACAIHSVRGRCGRPGCCPNPSCQRQDVEPSLRQAHRAGSRARPAHRDLHEVDHAWTCALAELKARLQFTVQRPQDNAYGMMLCSRLPLVDPVVRFLGP